LFWRLAGYEGVDSVSDAVDYQISGYRTNDLFSKVHCCRASDHYGGAYACNEACENIAYPV
jgi:hypothetical protein